MKIAFIHTPFVVEPLGIAYLSSILKLWGHETALFLTSEPNLEDLVSSYDVLAYSVITGSHDFYANLNRKIKKVRQYSIFGGPHPTYFPDYVYDPGIDFVVQGEAERSFPRLLKNLQTSPPLIRPDILIQDLDKIPLPDRRFLYKYPENLNNPIKNVMTSRGCPYSCPYCFNSLYRKMYAGQRWTRFRSPENVIKECRNLKENYPLKMIYFQDDEFLLNPGFNLLLDDYADFVGVPFHAQIRIEHLTEDKATRLKWAGCSGVTFAVESGDWEIRSGVLQRHIKDRVILKGAKILHSENIKFRIENMIGIPTETLSKMIKTIKFNQKLRPTIGWCSIFQPYPNLPLSEKAKEWGLWDGKLSMQSSFFDETILKTKWKKEISNIQRLFSLLVYLRCPSLIIRTLIGLDLAIPYKWIHNQVKKFLYRRLYGEA